MSSGFVLAGGKSSRMGQEKAFILFGGEPLVVRLVNIVRGAVEDVSIVGSRNNFPGYPSVVEDIYKEAGPLGGIHAALSFSQHEWNLVLAVDQPFMSPAFLRYLLAAAQKSRALVTVPRFDDVFQSLCAVYRLGFQEIADRALQAGHNRIDKLFMEQELRIIDLPEITKAGFAIRIFTNLNTPQELEFARSNNI